MISLADFIAKYNGKGIDFDKAYGNQCVDVINQYLTEALNLFPLGGDTAFHIFQNYTGAQLVKILNTPTGVPLPGDIMFWDQSVGTAGHTAIFLSGDVNIFTSFDQNWPVGSLSHKQDHTYNGVLGWLHPKTSVSNDLQVKFDAVNNKLQQIKNIVNS